MQSQTSMPMMPVSTTTSSECSGQLLRNLEALEMGAAGDPDTRMKLQQIRDLMAQMTNAYVDRANNIRQSMVQAQEELGQLQQRVSTDSPTSKSPNRKKKEKSNTPELGGRNPFSKNMPAATMAMPGASPLPTIPYAGASPMPLISAGASPVPLMSGYSADFSTAGASPLSMMSASPMPVMSASPMPMIYSMTQNAETALMPTMSVPGAATMPFPTTMTMLGHHATEPSQMAGTFANGGVPHLMQGWGDQGVQMMAPSAPEIQVHVPPAPPAATERQEVYDMPSALPSLAMPRKKKVVKPSGHSESFSSDLEATNPSGTFLLSVLRTPQTDCDSGNFKWFGPTPDPFGDAAPSGFGSLLRRPTRA